MLNLEGEVSGIRWLEAQNQSSETVPSGGLVRFTGYDYTIGLVACDKPNADGQDVLINGPMPMEGAGVGGAVTFDFPAWACYDPDDGQPAFGETWGAKANDWRLRKGKAGFKILTFRETDFMALVVPEKGGGGGAATITKSVANLGTATVARDTYTVIPFTFGAAQIFFSPGAPGRFTIPAGQPANAIYFLVGEAWFSLTDCQGDYGAAWSLNGNMSLGKYEKPGSPTGGVIRVRESTWMQMSQGHYAQFGVYHNSVTGAVQATGMTFSILSAGVLG